MKLILIALFFVIIPLSLFAGKDSYPKGTIFYIYVSTNGSEHSRLSVLETDTVTIGEGFNRWINQLKDKSLYHEEALPENFVIKNYSITLPPSK